VEKGGPEKPMIPSLVLSGF